MSALRIIRPVLGLGRVELKINTAARHMLHSGNCSVLHVIPNAPVPPADRGSYNHLLHRLVLRRASTDLVVSSFDPGSWQAAESSDLGVVQIAGRRDHLTDSLPRGLLSRTPGLSARQRHDLRLGRSAGLLSRLILTPAAPRVVCLWGDLRWAHLLRTRAPNAFLVFAQRHHRMSSQHLHYYPVVDETVFLTETARRDAITEGLVTANRSLSIRNGIDLSRFSPPSSEERRMARRELGIADDALVFLMPSTLSLRKGVFEAIQWFKMTEQPLHDLDPRLILAGPISPSMRREDVLSIERELNVPSILALRGAPASSMPQLFAAADICLHPSVNEGFGLAIVEAMATGLPVVAIDSGAVPELIETGVDGVLLPDRSDHHRAASTLISLARDAPLRERLGRAARRSALRFTRDGAVESWCTYLDSRLVASHGRLMPR